MTLADESSSNDILRLSSMRMRKSCHRDSLTGIGDPDNFICVEIPQKRREGLSLFKKIRQISNLASLLCVVDCTMLPAITVLTPLCGFIQLGSEELERIHHIGHAMALLFVLPVGSLSAMLNYFSHRQKSIASMAIVGLFLVAIANSHSLPVIGHIAFFHPFHHGLLHRLVSISGCALLLTSNYRSHLHNDRRKCCILHEANPSQHQTGLYQV